MSRYTKVVEMRVRGIPCKYVHLVFVMNTYNIIVFGGNGLDSETFVCGRPFVGCAIIFFKAFSSMILYSAYISWV